MKEKKKLLYQGCSVRGPPCCIVRSAASFLNVICRYSKKLRNTSGGYVYQLLWIFTLAARKPNHIKGCGLLPPHPPPTKRKVNASVLDNVRVCQLK